MTYQDAINKAMTESELHECVQHVNVIFDLGTESTPPTIAGYYVSDWADNSTVLSYSNGELG